MTLREGGSSMVVANGLFFVGWLTFGVTALVGGMVALALSARRPRAGVETGGLSSARVVDAPSSIAEAIPVGVELAR
ncbi:MAG: hypothetical protein M3256_27590 [Actinomycetota bacterium]|nr:hypothetical protein [Actinomycetota bacterium]